MHFKANNETICNDGSDLEMANADQYNIKFRHFSLSGKRMKRMRREVINIKAIVHSSIINKTKLSHILSKGLPISIVV